ncbi:MAG: hypothetical protein MZW92_31580 [Comamonadaceae bacterium]|nr:hypothetical protein [Comamonadaceae bacterium]
MKKKSAPTSKPISSSRRRSPPARPASGDPQRVCGRRAGTAFGFLGDRVREFSKTSATRGLVELVQVARFLVKVLRAVLARRAARRDHGLVRDLCRGGGARLQGRWEWRQ